MTGKQAGWVTTNANIAPKNGYPSNSLIKTPTLVGTFVHLFPSPYGVVVADSIASELCTPASNYRTAVLFHSGTSSGDA
jgi:hypothetical protein